jgi:hypothetical protein
MTGYHVSPVRFGSSAILCSEAYRPDARQPISQSGCPLRRDFFGVISLVSFSLEGEGLAGCHFGSLDVSLSLSHTCDNERTPIPGVACITCLGGSFPVSTEWRAVCVEELFCSLLLYNKRSISLRMRNRHWYTNKSPPSIVDARIRLSAGNGILVEETSHTEIRESGF